MERKNEEQQPFLDLSLSLACYPSSEHKSSSQEDKMKETIMPSPSLQPETALPMPVFQSVALPASAVSHKKSTHKKSTELPAHAAVVSCSAPRAKRRKRNQLETIAPAFPWSTDRHAKVHTIEYLKTKGFISISGRVKCRYCDSMREISFDLESKFKETFKQVFVVLYYLPDQAPDRWMNPVFQECKACKQPNCMKPVIADSKEQINWLFLFLGQYLGCCTLDHLKYFCSHNEQHQTGCKSSVLIESYRTICEQLDPTGPIRHFKRLEGVAVNQGDEGC